VCVSALLPRSYVGYDDGRLKLGQTLRIIYFRDNKRENYSIHTHTHRISYHTNIFTSTPGVHQRVQFIRYYHVYVCVYCIRIELRPIAACDNNNDGDNDDIAL